MNHHLPDSALLNELMAASEQRHRHLCPRQVLGLRLGLRGLRALGFADDAGRPRYENKRKRLLVIAETDGCGLDGIAVATDTAVGRRTLRVLDYGKVAATLVDTQTERAVRVSPSPASRALSRQYAPDARSRWHAYLEAYQVIPDEKLVVVVPVALKQPLAEIISRPGARAVCDCCGEEIINEREVVREGQTLCRICAGEQYYTPLKP
ncbi:MAG TPA: FmdE family protein [Candidatus Sulfomarinibacteraceae bacterium]|nr:FmdE family protein [Candidatus Sulfomarinibacteraceae bacterium]